MTSKTFINIGACFLFIQDILVNIDFSKFQSLKPHLLEEVDKMLANDIAKLMAMIPLQDVDNRQVKNGDSEPQASLVKGLKFTMIFYYYSDKNFDLLCMQVFYS